MRISNKKGGGTRKNNNNKMTNNDKYLKSSNLVTTDDDSDETLLQADLQQQVQEEQQQDQPEFDLQEPEVETRDEILQDIHKLYFVPSEEYPTQQQEEPKPVQIYTSNPSPNQIIHAPQQADPSEDLNEENLNLLAADSQEIIEKIPKTSTDDVKKSPVVDRVSAPPKSKDAPPVKKVDVPVKKSPAPKTPQKSQSQPQPPKQQPSKPKQPVAKPSCKSNSDCDADSFCVSKSGQCAQKYPLNSNTAVCTASDQCSGTASLCTSFQQKDKKKRCLQTCSQKTESICAKIGMRCNLFNGADLKEINGTGFEGICSSTMNTVTTTKTKGGNNGNLVTIVGVAVGVVLSIIIGYFLIRRILKKKYRNSQNETETTTNKKIIMKKDARNHKKEGGGDGSVIFLNNKSADRSSYNRSPSLDRLDSRMYQSSGARFTQWAPVAAINASNGV